MSRELGFKSCEISSDNGGRSNEIGDNMKSDSKREVKALVAMIAAAAVFWVFLLFFAFHPNYIKNDFPPGPHPFLGMLLTCFLLWVKSTIWLCAVNLLVLFVASPFLLRPSIRPAAIRAWIISTLAFLCARFIVFYASAM